MIVFIVIVSRYYKIWSINTITDLVHIIQTKHHWIIIDDTWILHSTLFNNHNNKSYHGIEMKGNETQMIHYPSVDYDLDDIDIMNGESW